MVVFAARTSDDLVVGIDELFEFVLTGITDVFVDRHRSSSFVRWC
jgi:hypothetical protein